MKLILYGIIIGLGKVIPGVSGALLAISLGVYEKIIDAITHFFDKPKENFKLLFSLGIGILLSIILFSKIIIYLFKNYYFISIMFFLGLIISSVIKYMKDIKYEKKKIIIISLIVIFFIIISKIKNAYFIISKNSLMYFFSGVIEVFTSIIPGISGTAIFISFGIYDDILLLISNIYNIRYIINNFIYYIMYFFGMFISFILTTLLVNYLSKKRKNIFEIIIISLTITSVILLIRSIDYNITIINLMLGLITLTIGLLLGYIC